MATDPNANYTYNSGWTVQDFLNASGAKSADGRMVWATGEPMSGKTTYDPDVFLNTPNQAYGGQTPLQYLTGLGIDPTNMSAAVPDVRDSSGDMGEMFDKAVMALVGAVVGGGIASWAGGAGALGGAGGAESFGAWQPGMTGGADFAGLTTAELGGGIGPIYGGGGLGAEGVVDPFADFGNAWEQAAAESANQNAALETANGISGGGGLGGLAKTPLGSLKAILESGGSIDDWLRLAGAAAPGLIGAFASNQQTGAITDLANKSAGFGAPYRQRLSDLYADPSSFLSSPEVQVPVQQGTDALARALSAKVGNPVGNMSAMGELQNYASNQLFGRLGQEKDRLAGFGGLSAYTNAAPGLEQSAIASNANMWNALGSSASNVFNPPTTLEQLLKGLKGSNITFGVA